MSAAIQFHDVTRLEVKPSHDTPGRRKPFSSIDLWFKYADGSSQIVAIYFDGIVRVAGQTIEVEEMEEAA